jgi:hypothetical protein
MCESTQLVHFNAGVNHPAARPLQAPIRSRCPLPRTALYSRGGSNPLVCCSGRDSGLEIASPPARLQPAQGRAQYLHLRTGSRRGRQKDYLQPLGTRAADRGPGGGDEHQVDQIGLCFLLRGPVRTPSALMRIMTARKPAWNAPEAAAGIPRRQEVPRNGAKRRRAPPPRLFD